MNAMIDILTDTPQTKLMQIAGRVKQRRLGVRMTQAALAMRADIPLPTKADVLALAKEQGLNVQRAEMVWEEMARQIQIR